MGPRQPETQLESAGLGTPRALHKERCAMSTSVSFVIRHVRWTALVGALMTCLGIGARANAGKAQQGTSLQGTQMPGAGGDWLQGASLVVTLRDGSMVEILHFAGSTIEAIEVTEPRATSYPELRTLHPDDLVGMQWSELRCDPAGCTGARFRVEAASSDPSTNTMINVSSNRDTWLYRVQYAETSAAGAETWADACDALSSDTDMGLFVSGHWSPDGTWDPSGYTFSCPRGVIAKCARSWGYKPWKILHTALHGAIDLQPLHLACVRAARADYCGNGVSHTRDGVLIDMFDAYGFNEREPTPGFVEVEESAFDEHGAVHLGHARLPRAMAAAGRGGAPTCRREAIHRRRAPALIHIWSSPHKAL
jgi:hypothetical protein